MRAMRRLLGSLVLYPIAFSPLQSLSAEIQCDVRPNHLSTYYGLARILFNIDDNNRTITLLNSDGDEDFLLMNLSKLKSVPMSNLSADSRFIISQRPVGNTLYVFIIDRHNAVIGIGEGIPFKIIEEHPEVSSYAGTCGEYNSGNKL